MLNSTLLSLNFVFSSSVASAILVWLNMDKLFSCVLFASSSYSWWRITVLLYYKYYINISYKTKQKTEQYRKESLLHISLISLFLAVTIALNVYVRSWFYMYDIYVIVMSVQVIKFSNRKYIFAHREKMQYV